MKKLALDLPEFTVLFSIAIFILIVSTQLNLNLSREEAIAVSRRSFLLQGSVQNLTLAGSRLYNASNGYGVGNWWWNPEFSKLPRGHSAWEVDWYVTRVNQTCAVSVFVDANVGGVYYDRVDYCLQASAVSVASGIRVNSIDYLMNV